MPATSAAKDTGARATEGRQGAGRLKQSVAAKQPSDSQSCSRSSCENSRARASGLSSSCPTTRGGSTKDREPPRKFMRFEMSAAVGLSFGGNHSAPSSEVVFTRKGWPSAQTAWPTTSQAKDTGQGSRLPSSSSRPTCSRLSPLTSEKSTAEASTLSSSCASPGPQRSMQPKLVRAMAMTKVQRQPRAPTVGPVTKAPGT
mmetsp:Transcript_81325/g.263409  ORF Transcript_81325/g.263409 Transcript_81325/m.263409 type:complete len:200 (-) Transcript_81325:58-657(-)